MRNKYFFVGTSNTSGSIKKVAMKLLCITTESDCDFYKAKSRPIKATKENVKLLHEYCKENNSDYTYCCYDCTGSSSARYKVRIKKGKCWISEYRTYDV